MSTNFCPNCGASIEIPARFCRRCGTRLDVQAPAPGTEATASEATASEATTRELDQPASYDPLTQVFNSGTMGPAYMQPGPFSNPMSPIPQPQMPQRHSYKWLVIVALLFLVALSALAIVGPGLAQKVADSIRGGQSVSAGPAQPPAGPQQPPSGLGPGNAPPPPAPPSGPPSQPSRGALNAKLEALRYPGAQVRMSTTEGDGDKDVAAFFTADDIGKVTDWYAKKINPTKRVEIPFGISTILKNADTTVVLTGGGGGTNIVIKLGDDD